MLSAPGLRSEFPSHLSPLPSLENHQEILSRLPTLPFPKNTDERFYQMEESWNDRSWLQLAARLDILNSVCAQNDKNEMEDNQATVDRENKKLNEETEAARQKENEAGKWGIALLTFSCIASMTAIITGVALIATGVGAVAGCLILAGGLIQIGSQIMELTGGWNKVKALLPGNDEDKKNAIITWIQLGITIFCMILAGAGAVTGGFGLIGENMSKASGLMGAIALIGKGTSEIGQGVTKRDLNNHRSAQKKQEAKIADLKYRWQDLMENQEERMSVVKNIYQAMHTTFEQNHDFTKKAWGR